MRGTLGRRRHRIRSRSVVIISSYRKGNRGDFALFLGWLTTVPLKVKRTAKQFVTVVPVLGSRLVEKKAGVFGVDRIELHGRPFASVGRVVLGNLFLSL